MKIVRNSSSGSGSDSYLEMWKKAMERERCNQVIQSSGREGTVDDDMDYALKRKTELFEKILAVPREERDRVQRLQVIDRAAAAISAARALIKKPPPDPLPTQVSFTLGEVRERGDDEAEDDDEENEGDRVSDESGGTSGGVKPFRAELEELKHSSPGPDFWSWSPPEDSTSIRSDLGSNLQSKLIPNVVLKPSLSLMEKEASREILPIPFQSTLSQTEHAPPLPPLQSIVELEKIDTSPSSTNQPELDEVFSSHAAEAAAALGSSNNESSGVKLDGSKWWKETGTETKADGIVIRWTLTRGVSADGSVEWEDKFWEASDQFDYKELGSEKSGRDAAGNVWREFWKESMWQDINNGLVHMEKFADKWGKDTQGSEWHEKWWEHYDATGQAEKWADKWCSIDPNTPLHAGHAHVWHERWGEQYDGKGGSSKYTDKWAERCEGDGWSKWGDKWDENFNLHGHGTKQGETWWQGKHGDGDQWNRTWGEKHNGTGWIQKYGRSSCGEHWDTYAQEETWYERHPHFGFDHCFQNSHCLRSVSNPPPQQPKII